jgi:membrane protein DedA with SNARE-associated domain
MKKVQFGNWMGVIISAVVLGLAVTFLIKAWKPVDAPHWILWVMGVLIAIRSVMRIAELSKKINEKEE